LRLKGLLFILIEMLRSKERPSHRPDAVSHRRARGTCPINTGYTDGILREHDMLMWSSYFVKTVGGHISNH